MATGAWTLTNNSRLRLAKGNFNIDAATLKCALFLSTSNIGTGSTTYAGVTNEHANANGYTTGGVAVDFVYSGTSTVSLSFVTNPVWIASGGSIVARFAVIYEVSGDVFAYQLLNTTPADETVTTGNQFVLDSDGTPNPTFTVT